MSTSRRAPALLAGLLLLLAPLCPPAAEGFQEKGGLFIVVSITPMGQGAIDVKLKNPRTGYIHSVTLHISIPLNFKVGDLVEERRDPRRGVVLIPIRDEGGGEDQGGDDDGHLKPVGWPSDPGGKKPPPTNPVLPNTEGPLKGYIVVPIGALQVINSSGVGKENSKDAVLGKGWVTSGKCAVLANGSFTANYVTPAVPVVRGGRLDTAGYGKSLADADKGLSSNGKITTDGRGGIAVLRDGTIVIGRQNGRSLAEIQSAFGREGKQVWDFMGGGAMLLEGGNEVSTTDLFEQQGFVDQDKGRVLYRGTRKNLIPRTGFEAGQFASGRHTLVGVQGGQPYLIVSPNRGGRQLQSELKAGGFSDVVKFDGGRGFYFTDGQTEIRGRGDGTGGNSLGLCVQTP